ncbi:MAG: hypothetical protein ACFE9Z_17305 [Promethearchaeota archaeon]
MFDVDIGPPDTVYIYECKICKRELQYSGIIKCDICKINLCIECNKEGLCPDHFNELSPEDQSILIQISQQYNKKRKNIYPIFTIIYFLVVLPLIYMVLSSKIPDINIRIMFICFIVSGILGLGLITLLPIFCILNKHYLKKKSGLFSKYKQTDTKIQ